MSLVASVFTPVVLADNNNKKSKSVVVVGGMKGFVGPHWSRLLLLLNILEKRM